ncbi:MAG: hypothetical protein CMH83_19555 [Nocardioides sp.]|nr:hypothetical protein [Nocardioides sp.]
MIPGDPRHGTDTGYAAGCREACCRAAHARDRRRSRQRAGRPLVPALGTRRRTQALARLGWSTAELSREVGRTRSWLYKVLRNDRVQVETALVVADLYERLSMTRCTAASAGRTATMAAAKGWPPPLAWTNIDDPDENPRLMVARAGLADPVVVDRILSGDWHLTATRAEKAAVLRRWQAAGRADRELENLTGWNVARDVRPHVPRKEAAA